MDQATKQVTNAAVEQLSLKTDANRARECDESGQRQEVHPEQRLGITPDDGANQEDRRDPEQQAIGLRQVEQSPPMEDRQHQQQEPGGEGEVEPARNGRLQQAPSDPERDAGTEQVRSHAASHQLDAESAVSAMPLRRCT